MLSIQVITNWLGLASETPVRTLTIGDVVWHHTDYHGWQWGRVEAILPYPFLSIHEGKPSAYVVSLPGAVSWSDYILLPDTVTPDCDCPTCGGTFVEAQLCPNCGVCWNCCDCAPATMEPDTDDKPDGLAYLERWFALLDERHDERTAVWS